MQRLVDVGKGRRRAEPAVGWRVETTLAAETPWLDMAAEPPVARWQVSTVAGVAPLAMVAAVARDAATCAT